MDVSTSRILTPARIVARTPIVILISRLAYLRFAQGPGTVSVSAGTKVGTLGLPVGLGPYLARVNRDWPTRIKIIGLAAAIGGALIGRWLGFYSTEAFVALITMIVAANLLLLALDTASASQRTGCVIQGNRTDRPVVLQA